MHFLLSLAQASWHLLLDAAPYILLGIVMGGLLKSFLSAEYVARHLGQGRFLPVFKAAIFGIPLPLCSCGVLPAAAALKRQGANNGATTAFLVSTPESGVDSISVTYALLDPIMTVARPLAAFLSAMVAGVAENLRNPPRALPPPLPMAAAGAQGRKEGTPASIHWREKIIAGLRYAFADLWGDLAGWFFLGLLLAGLITVLVPEEFLSGSLGGGLPGMLLMLAFGIPLYICATASTPIAAALILKGVSPGAALVFLLVGPATNVATLSVLVGLLGKRATLLYLGSIAITAVLCGLALDAVYASLGISARAIVGQAGEILPASLQHAAALLILLLSLPPLLRKGKEWRQRRGGGQKKEGCACPGGRCGGGENGP
jgi:uncharacterized protein